MLEPSNPYTRMQKDQYEREADLMNQENHRQHDSNSDYLRLLLLDVAKNPAAWTGKAALDFGCGCGRNISNLIELAPFAIVDGVDIAQGNLNHAAENVLRETGSIAKTTLFCNNGVDLSAIPSDRYDFVMSTIVFQHIPVWTIRFGLLKEIYRVMKPAAVLSFQMAFGINTSIATAAYSEDVMTAHGTNGVYDVSVRNQSEVVEDLKNIRFTKITTAVTKSWTDSHPQWIYIRCEK